MTKENSFSWQVRFYGLLGLLGLVAFLLSLIIIHVNLKNSDIDWMRYYVSYLANGSLGWVFITGTIIHGFGNLALALGMRGALPPGRLREWGVMLFGLAAAGILLTALFSIDPPGQPLSIDGRIHRTAASATFSLELAALFVFSTAFGRHHYWRRQRFFSRVLSISAAVALSMFVISLQLDVVPGLTERIALAVFLLWEFWIAVQLVWSH